MLINKYVRTFLENVSGHTVVTDLQTTQEYQNKITNARNKFEEELTSALILLSDEQQARLLLQTLENFENLESHFHSEDFQYGEYTGSQTYRIAINLKINYLRFVINNVPNKPLERGKAKLLMRLIVSEEAVFAQLMTYQSYASKVGAEKSAKWRLKKFAFAKTSKKEKLLDAELLAMANDSASNNENTIKTENHYYPVLLKWRYGLNDFAELLYKLERTGAIDLKSYFANGGKGVALARSFCQLFSFSPTANNPIGTLNNYISELRKGLGRGPYDLGILKAIGRARNGTMDNVLPDEPEPDTP